MPPPALKSLADKAGKSLKNAERYYSDAKKQRMKDTGKEEKGLTDKDYRYIMGVTKKRLGLPTKKIAASVAEAMIEHRITTESNDFDVRVFRDLNGDVSFATLDDVHVDPADDPRTALVHKLATEYAWPHNHSFPEEIEGYEGSVDKLAQNVVARFFPGLGCG